MLSKYRIRLMLLNFKTTDSRVHLEHAYQLQASKQETNSLMLLESQPRICNGGNKNKLVAILHMLLLIGLEGD